FFSSRRRHTRCLSDWSSDVCSSDLLPAARPLTEVSGRAAGSDDLVANIQWRGVRATILARQGRIKTAERLGREAVELASSSDFRSEERRAGKECRTRGARDRRED